MAISIRQVMAENNRSQPTTMPQKWTVSREAPASWSGLQEAALAWLSETQQLALQFFSTLYHQLRNSNRFLSQGFNSPWVPTPLVQSSSPSLKRIVEIGCGDGTYAQLLAVQLPNVEIVGIDTDAHKIEKAQSTMGHLNNLRFVHGNAYLMDEIPCDRIVYNHCLSNSESLFKFKKLIFKTSQWLVDEGDFWIKESVPELLVQPSLLQLLAATISSGNALDGLISQPLESMGYPLGKRCLGRGFLGFSSEFFLQAFPQDTAPWLEGETQLSSTSELEYPDWQDAKVLKTTPMAEKTNDALVGFLFEQSQADWQKILT